MQEPDPHVLSSFEELLRRPDFILEPRCWDTIVKYIKAGGKPEQLVESLSDSYVGYAQMASLICQWLKLADDKVPDSGGPSTSNARHSDRDDALDEFHFLKEFTKQKFDSEKVSGVFSQNSGKPPPWLENLTQDSRGRQLIYELSAAHRNCLLLNYGIQKILLQGHEDEVATVGSSLASYFSVFHRLLVARLRTVASLCNAAVPPEQQHSLQNDLPSLARELVDSCAHSLHTYLHTQKLLVWLSSHPQGQVFMRMSQELEQAAAASHPAAWILLGMLLPPGSSPQVIKATGMVSGILSSPTPHTSLDLSRLSDLYRLNPHLPVHPIQHPQLIKILTSIIFTPGKHLATDVQASAIELLSRSTSCHDDEPDQDEAARVEATREALQAALRLGQHAQSKMTPDDGPDAYLVAEVPAACIGIIHYIKHFLSQWEYYHSEAGSQNATPIFARIAIFVAKKQPELLHLVTDVFESALRALGSQRAELAKVFLDATAVLLRDCGWSKEVSDMVDRWSKEADPSLVRYLIHQMLAVLAGPYSPAFASWLLRHMTASGIRRVRDGQRGGGRSAVLLQEFAVDCSKLPFSPLLGTKEAALLQELQVAR